MAAGPAAPRALRRAYVERIGGPALCAMLHFEERVYLASAASDHLWRSVMFRLAALCKRCPVVLLDGPPGVRRDWFAEHLPQSRLLVASYAMALSWAEDRGHVPDAVDYFLRTPSRPGPPGWLFVDGVHGIPPAEQLRLLSRLPAGLAGVVLAGDTGGRAPEPAAAATPAATARNPRWTRGPSARGPRRRTPGWPRRPEAVPRVPHAAVPCRGAVLPAPPGRPGAARTGPQGHRAGLAGAAACLRD